MSRPGDAMAVDWGTVMVKLGLSGLDTSDHASVVSINIFVTLICACIVIGHLLEENRWMNESITSLIIVSLCFCCFRDKDRIFFFWVLVEDMW